MAVINITIALLPLAAGLLLGGAMMVAAVVDYRRRRGPRRVLICLTAAFAALASSATVLFDLALYAGAGAPGSFAVNGARVAFTFVAVFLSIPAGALWGWALSVCSDRKGAAGRGNNRRTLVLGLLSVILFTCLSAMLTLGIGLARYGHDDTTAFPDLCALTVFLVVNTCFSAKLAWIFRNDRMIIPLGQIESIYTSAAILSIGMYITLSTAYTLLFDLSKVGEKFGLLILFFPFYIIISFAIGGIALYFGCRMAAGTWSRLVSA